MKLPALHQTFSFVGILLCILLCGCVEEKKAPPTLHLAHAPHDHHAPLYIAASNPNYFKENGGIYLEMVTDRQQYHLIAKDEIVAVIQVHRSIGGKEIIRKLSEGHYDLALGGVPAMLHFIDKNADIEILSPVMAEGASLVLAKKIKADNWEQFVDLVREVETPLRIGYKIEVSTHNQIFEQALLEEGISYTRAGLDTDAKIKIVNLFGAHNLIPALEADVIDGFVVNQPYPAMAEFTGQGKAIASLSELPPLGKWRGHPCCALAGRSEYVAAHPDLTIALTTLLMRANRYIVQNSEKSVKDIAAWLNIPTQVEELSLPTIRFTSEMDENWNSGVEFWFDSMKRRGQLKGELKKTTDKHQLTERVYNLEIYRQALGNQ